MTSFGENMALVAAIFSALATALAAYATWRGPESAARLAEKLRRDNEHYTEKRRLKLHLFATLMQERAAIYSTQAVQALNLIDVVYADSRGVREAWAELFLAFNPREAIPSHVRDERLRKLLSVMAMDLGLAAELRTDDLGRVYYPTALAEEERVRTLERQAALARLQSDQLPSANTVFTQSSIWPPPPNGKDD